MNTRSLLSVCLVATVLAGCGPSLEEQMYQAAARQRSPDPEDAAAAPEAGVQAAPLAAPQRADHSAPKATTQPLLASRAASSPMPAASAPPGTSDAPPASDRSLAAEPLSPPERNRRSAENLQRIGTALAAYVAKNHRLPATAMKTANGIKTLSWRVELLPYLGYQGLFEKFDPQQPWDSPHNVALLDEIPDCYLSPERMDANTNYLGIAGSTYLFQDSPVIERRIEDGLENTLAVIEVDDSLSVPWTSPADYAPEYGRAAAGIGSLRDGGTYAVWGNGWTTLLKAGISSATLHRAFTYESQDGLLAGEIHNPITHAVAPVESQSAAGEIGGMVAGEQAAGSPADAGPADRAAARGAPRGNGAANGAGESAEFPVVRMPVPNRADRTEATAEVRALFEARFKNADSLERRRELVREMLATAPTLTADPAGAFAMLQGAVSAASSLSDVPLMSLAIDHTVAMFDVDAVDANATALVALENHAKGEIDSRAYLQRALPVLAALLAQDRYAECLEITQLAGTLEARTPEREFVPDLNRLRHQLTLARNYHSQTRTALEQLRSDPSDPQASFAVGKYLAFIRGDWRRGLPLLVGSAQGRLAEVARLDLATGSDAEGMLATADAWWEVGEATTSELFRGGCRARACHWYAAAVEEMPESLSRMRASARLDEGQRTGEATLESLMERLATDLGLDLPTALEQIRRPRVGEPESLTAGAAWPSKEWGDR